jgi:hypothetical protein
VRLEREEPGRGEEEDTTGAQDAGDLSERLIELGDVLEHLDR